MYRLAILRFVQLDKKSDRIFHPEDMTRLFAKKLGLPITVNAICPGAEMNPKTDTVGINLRRLGTPEDIGQVVAFRASSEPDFITGQAITVDGFQYLT